MNKILLFLALFLPFLASAQGNAADILAQIELNNPTLAALRKQADADKIAARTGIAPSDPEVEFHYLWGASGASGNRVDVSVKQSFDFPSVYAYKSKVAKLSGEQFELQYRVGRMELLTAARQLYIDIIYCNAMIVTANERIANATTMAQTYARSLASGEGTSIENNRMQMTLRTMQVELQALRSERDARLTELKGFNGDQAIEVPNDRFEDATMPSSFEQWGDRAVLSNPTLQYAMGQVSVSEKEFKVAKAQWLPKISVGYMTERVLSAEHFQGITAGISLPLWENSRAVNASKANTIAQKYKAEQVRIDTKTQLEALYQRAQGLKITAENYSLALKELSNMPLLEKALNAGQISLFEYILESQLYYDNADKAMLAQRDFQLCFAQLLAFEL